MKKNIIIISILFIYSLITNLINFTPLSKYNNLFIMPIGILIIAIITAIMLPSTERRIKYKYEKNQNALIILIIYSILYFISGLIFGYEYSVYKHDLFSIIKNIYMFILPIILQEYIRNRLVNNTKENLKNNILISVLFIIVNINLKYLIKNIFPLNIGFKYLSVELFPIIVTSFIMTNLSRIAGKNSTILYRIFLKIPPIILPILPSVPWIITAIISIFLPLFIYYNILYFNMFYTKRERRFSNNKNYLDIPIIIISVFLILFILKAFKYYPIAVLSDSMEDTFQRGDSVIIEKIDDNNLKNIEKHDIIYYKKDSKYIIHRVVSIEEKEGEKIFITKGDNNQENDDWDVYEEEILGIMKISIPNIGYPAVWLYEILNN